MAISGARSAAATCNAGRSAFVTVAWSTSAPRSLRVSFAVASRRGVSITNCRTEISVAPSRNWAETSIVGRSTSRCRSPKLSDTFDADRLPSARTSASPFICHSTLALAIASRTGQPSCRPRTSPRSCARKPTTSTVPLPVSSLSVRFIFSVSRSQRFEPHESVISMWSCVASARKRKLSNDRGRRPRACSDTKPSSTTTCIPGARSAICVNTSRNARSALSMENGSASGPGSGN